MTPDSQSSKKSLLQRTYYFTFLVLIVVAAYIAFVFVARYQSNRAYEKRSAQKAAEQRRADDRAAREQLGGSDLTIRTLYAVPPIIRRGESAQLCYDVSNAKTVTLDPPEGEVWPSHSRCVDLAPKKTTAYTLTVADSSGKTLSQSVTLQVR